MHRADMAGDAITASNTWGEGRRPVDVTPPHYVTSAK